jgi:hypothetical protein
MDKKMVKFILQFFWIIFFLMTCLCSAQVIITEDFTGNTYDTDNFQLLGSTGDGVCETNSFSICNDRLEAEEGCCGAESDDYGSSQFRTKVISSVASSFDVRGRVSKVSSSGNRSGMVGIWADANHYMGIAVDNVYASDGTVTLIIHNGGGDGEFVYEFNTALDITDNNLYRVIYDRPTNEISFYYDNEGTWTQLGTTQIVDFGSTQFYAGLFFGVFNITVGADAYGDDLYVDYCPHEAVIDIEPSITIISPTQGALYYKSNISINWEYINPAEIVQTDSCVPEYIQDETTVIVITDNDNPIDTVFNGEEAELNNFFMGVGSHTITLTMYHYDLIPDGVGGEIEFWNVNEPLATDNVGILIMEQRDIKIISITPIISSSAFIADSLKIKVGFAGKLDKIRFFYELNEEWIFWKMSSGNTELDYNELDYSFPIYEEQYNMTAIKIESHPDTVNWKKKIEVLDVVSMVKDRRICNSVSVGIVKTGWALDLSCGWSACSGIHKGSTTLTTIVNADTFYYEEAVSQFFVPSCDENGAGLQIDKSPPPGAGSVDGTFPFTKDGWTYSLNYYPVNNPLQASAARIMGTYDGVTYELINNLPTFSFDGTSWAQGRTNNIFVKYNYSAHEGQKYFEVMLARPFTVVYAFSLLEPLDLTVYSDEEEVDLSAYPKKINLRTYFRGIHPKIRKF